MLVPPERSSAVLLMVSSKSVSVCNRSLARRANSGKIDFLGGYPSLMPSFEGNLLTQRHHITSLETRDSRLSYGENLESLSHLGLIRYRVVTPGHIGTDRIAIGNYAVSSTWALSSVIIDEKVVNFSPLQKKFKRLISSV